MTSDPRAFDPVAWYMREAKALSEQHSPILLWVAALMASMDYDYLASPPLTDVVSAVDRAVARMERWRNPMEGIERVIPDLRETFHDDPAVERAEKQAAMLCEVEPPKGTHHAR